MLPPTPSAHTRTTPHSPLKTSPLSKRQKQKRTEREEKRAKLWRIRSGREREREGIRESMGSLSSKNLFIFKLASPTVRRHSQISPSPASLPLFYSLLTPKQGRKGSKLNTFFFRCQSIFSPLLKSRVRKKTPGVSNRLVETRGLDTVILCPHSPFLPPSLFPSW